MKKLTILVSALFLITYLATYVASKTPITFDMLKQGKDLFENNCIDCHDLDWPLKKVTDRAGWEEILTKMANTGAVVGKEERTMILEYLLAKSTFQKQCILCHGPERALEKNKTIQQWIITVRKMVGKKPGLLTEQEIKNVSGFLTIGM